MIENISISCGSVTLNAGSENFGVINADVILNGNAVNSGTINGNLTLTGTASNNGTVSGSVTDNTDAALYQAWLESVGEGHYTENGFDKWALNHVELSKSQYDLLVANSQYRPFSGIWSFNTNGSGNVVVGHVYKYNNLLYCLVSYDGTYNDPLQTGWEPFTGASVVNTTTRDVTGEFATGSYINEDGQEITTYETRVVATYRTTYYADGSSIEVQI